MSWITDLAGRAEDILIKIDKNAANVLQQPARNENIRNSDPEKKPEESIMEGLKRNLSASSLSLTKSVSPKKTIRNDLKLDDSSSKSERKTTSYPSSRRSSISSRADGTVIEHDMSSSLENTNSNINRNDKNSFTVAKELSAMRIMLGEITAERNDLQNEIYSLQDEIKQNRGENQIRELEEFVNNLTIQLDEKLSKINEIESTNADYIKSISELEINLSKARQSILELSEKLETQSKEVELRTHELLEYRKKAHVTLQIKDKLIAELKTKGCNVTDAGENSNERILNCEIESLRQENSHLQDEIKTLASQVHNSKGFITKLEQQIIDKNIEFSKIQDSLKKLVQTEQQRSQQIELEIKIVNQEMQAVREESNRQRQSFLARIHEKDNELMKLRTHMAETPGYSDGNNLESRMQNLTQALVQKQASVETVTAERNALRLQLEKVEDQLHHVRNQQRQQRTQIISINDTDDAKAQLPLLLRENPFDNNMARRVKRAYSSLDSAGIRIGVFLRRYPLIRIMVFIYVALLHLWVMFVLLFFIK